VARVDRCQGVLVATIKRESVKTGLKDSLSPAPERRIPAEKLEFLTNTLRKQAVEARRLGARRGFAVGTAVFREAANGAQAINELSGKAGVRVRLISQVQEGLLGQRSAVIGVTKREHGSPEKRMAIKDAVIWDIGGGSQQLVVADSVLQSDIASVGFKERVLSLQGKSAESGRSPNPIDQNTVAQALSAAEEIGRGLRANHRGVWPTESAIGIGGVLAKSVAKRLGKESWTRAELEQALTRWTGATDAELKSEFAATEVTNLILVLGMMRGLSFNSVHSVDVDLTDALLVDGERGLR
jgi:exopolyphosphatase/guanosine-5'-triphosphate,3'-diphosphate pyrophosphatase